MHAKIGGLVRRVCECTHTHHDNKLRTHSRLSDVLEVDYDPFLPFISWTLILRKDLLMSNAEHLRLGVRPVYSCLPIQAFDISLISTPSHIPSLASSTFNQPPLSIRILQIMKWTPSTWFSSNPSTKTSDTLSSGPPTATKSESSTGLGLINFACASTALFAASHLLWPSNKAESSFWPTTGSLAYWGCGAAVAATWVGALGVSYAEGRTMKREKAEIARLAREATTRASTVQPVKSTKT